MSNFTASTKSPRELRRDARRKRSLLYGAIAVALLGLLLAARPMYHALKARRAAHFAAEGNALFAQERWNDAAAKYRAALQLDPLGLEGLRGAARLATRVARPEAWDLWEQVVKLPASTATDRQEFAGLAVQLGRMEVAERAIGALVRSQPDAATLTLATLFFQRKGNREKALEFARAAAKAAPNDGAAPFRVAELLAASDSESERAEAREILWAVSARPGKYQHAALDALARAPELPRDEQQRVLSALKNLPDSTVTDDLLIADLALRLDPDAAAKIYDETIAKWSAGPVATQIDLLRWLNAHAQFDRSLTLVSNETALTNSQLLLARLDALAALARWDEIDAILARADLPLDPSVAESFRARAAQARGQTLDVRVHWDRALALAGGDAGKLRFVANFAEQSQAYDRAIDAYQQLARHPGQADFAYRACQRLLEQSPDTAAARAIAAKLAALAPNDADAADQLAYLDFLTGEISDANLDKAKARAQSAPNRLAYRVTLALGFLEKHDAGAALAQFSGPAPIDWTKTPAAWRAVYAAALVANDDAARAREIAAAIPRERLKPEERRLIAALE
jgi:tetratricopeptide (TPR) repeat protein